MTSSDIEIEIFTESFRDHFSILPNALHRGEDDWSGMTGRGRNMLSALLTFHSGWKISRSRIDRLDPTLGHRAIDTVLKELRQRRHLYTRRVNAGGGRFRWQWKVFLRPQPADVDVWVSGYVPVGRVVDVEGSTNHQRGIDEGSSNSGAAAQPASPTIVPSQHNGRDQGKQDVSAGRTIRTSPMDGQQHGIRSNPQPEVPEVEETVDACKQACPPGFAGRHASPRSGEGSEQTKTKQDRQQRKRDRDDQEARTLLVDVYELNPDDAHLLVLYLRWHDNATSTAALAQHLIDSGPAAVDEKLDEARAWADSLDEAEANDRKFFARNWQLPVDDAVRLAFVFRHVYAIGAGPAATDAVNAAHGRQGWTVADLHAAVAGVVAEREEQRAAERRAKAAKLARERKAAA